MFAVVEKKRLSRRAVLRGAGVVMALPWLDAMLPALASKAQAAEALAPSQTVRRDQLRAGISRAALVFTTGRCRLLADAVPQAARGTSRPVLRDLRLIAP